MTPSKTAVDSIKRFEGCRLAAYPDPGSGGDPWTIGYGATGAGIKRGVVWSQQQANERLAADVARFGEQVAALLDGAQTSQCQFDAMTSLSYNVGIRNLGSSTLLRMHRSRDFEGAAGQFARWNKAAGKPMAGLTTRRAAEAAIYRGEV